MSKKHSRTEVDLDPSVAAILAAAPGNHATNNQRHRASYDLKPETIEMVRVIADKLGVPIYAVAQRFLDYAIEEHEAGRLEMKRKPVITSWELE